jgi:hypothetical protein
VLRETTSRGLCGLVCSSRTSERGGEGDCVKEGGGGEGERERERALGLLLCHSPRHCGSLTQGGALVPLVPLVRESNPKLQGGWCKPNHQPNGDLEPTQGGVL